MLKKKLSQRKHTHVPHECINISQPPEKQKLIQDAWEQSFLYLSALGRLADTALGCDHRGG